MGHPQLAGRSDGAGKPDSRLKQDWRPRQRNRAKLQNRQKQTARKQKESTREEHDDRWLTLDEVLDEAQRALGLGAVRVLHSHDRVDLGTNRESAGQNQNESDRTADAEAGSRQRAHSPDSRRKGKQDLGSATNRKERRKSAEPTRTPASATQGERKRTA